jgi:hypothetical protein
MAHLSPNAWHMTALKGGRTKRGVAAIELALLMVLFLMPLTFGVIELSRAVNQYNTVAKAVRDASRYLSNRACPFGGSGAAVLTAAQNLVRYGSTASGGDLIAPGLAGASISVTFYARSGTVTGPPSSTTCEVFAGSGGTGATGLQRYVAVEVTGYTYSMLLAPLVSFGAIGFGPIRATFPRLI